MNGRCETDPLDHAVDVCDRCYGEFCEEHLVQPRGRKHPFCSECTLEATGVRGASKFELRGSRKTAKKRRAELKEANHTSSQVFQFFDHAEEPEGEEPDDDQESIEKRAEKTTKKSRVRGRKRKESASGPNATDGARSSDAVPLPQFTPVTPAVAKLEQLRREAGESATSDSAPSPSPAVSPTASDNPRETPASHGPSQDDSTPPAANRAPTEPGPPAANRAAQEPTPPAVGAAAVEPGPPGPGRAGQGPTSLAAGRAAEPGRAGAGRPAQEPPASAIGRTTGRPGGVAGSGDGPREPKAGGGGEAGGGTPYLPARRRVESARPVDVAIAAAADAERRARRSTDPPPGEGAQRPARESRPDRRAASGPPSAIERRTTAPMIGEVRNVAGRRADDVEQLRPTAAETEQQRPPGGALNAIDEFDAARAPKRPIAQPAAERDGHMEAGATPKARTSPNTSANAKARSQATPPGSRTKPAPDGGTKASPEPKTAAHSGTKGRAGAKTDGNSGTKAYPGPKTAAHSGTNERAGANPATDGGTEANPGPKTAAHSGTKANPGPKTAADSGTKANPGPKTAADSGSKEGAGPKPATDGGPEERAGADADSNSGARAMPETEPAAGRSDGGGRADIDANGDWIPPILRGIAPDAKEAKANLPKRARDEDS